MPAYSPSQSVQQRLINVFPQLSSLTCLFILFGCSSTLNADVAEDQGLVQAGNTPTPATLDPDQLRRGKLLFLQCRACHSTDAADGHLVGPNLAGLFGATAGSKEDFVYSQTLTDSGVIWTTETLDAFLLDPGAYFVGTKMAFIGMKDDADRRLLIDWLEVQAVQ